MRFFELYVCVFYYLVKYICDSDLVWRKQFMVVAGNFLPLMLIN